MVGVGAGKEFVVSSLATVVIFAASVVVEVAIAEGGSTDRVKACRRRSSFA